MVNWESFEMLKACTCLLALLPDTPSSRETHHGSEKAGQPSESLNRSGRSRASTESEEDSHGSLHP